MSKWIRWIRAEKPVKINRTERSESLTLRFHRLRTRRSAFFRSELTVRACNFCTPVSVVGADCKRIQADPRCLNRFDEIVGGRCVGDGCFSYRSKPCWLLRSTDCVFLVEREAEPHRIHERIRTGSKRIQIPTNTYLLMV